MTVEDPAILRRASPDKSLSRSAGGRAAAVVLTVFGAHTMVWGVIVTTLMQRGVPDHLRGRVGSVYSLILTGGAALGSLLGGLFASGLGITAPFWIAAAVMVATTVTGWRPLRSPAEQGR